MIVDIKLSEKNFDLLLDYMNLLIESVCSYTESDRETLEAQIELLELKRCIAQYTLDFKTRESTLNDISELIKICYELLDEIKIKEDLIKRGLIEDDSTRKIKDIKPK